MGKSVLSRRSFIKGATAAGTGALILPTTGVFGANDSVNVGVIGCGGRGRGHIKWAEKSGARVVAVCDADTEHMDMGANMAGNPASVKKYQDLRDLLNDKNVDAVIIATPNHWHALATVMACQAGKDVYVEKPASHSIWEGRKMVEAAHKYKRIVQVGTQQRSDPALITLRKLIENKELGEVEWIHSLWYAERKSIGKVKSPQPIPENIDYDLWCGPREVVPLMRKKLHYDWHWFWPYGNGDMGNRVVHNIDDVHFIMQMGNDIPTRMMAVGGRFKYNDDATTPNTESIFADWKVPIIFGSRNMPFVHPKTGVAKGTSVYKRFGNKFRFTNIVKCEDGYFAATRGGGAVFNNDGKKIRKIKGDGGGKHMKNFINAVKSRRAEDLHARIDNSYMGNLMMLIGNISYRCGETADVDTISEQVDYCEEGRETWRQMQEHLALNNVDLKTERATLGPWLTFDPKRLRFTGKGAARANSFVREDMRKQYSIPETFN